MPVEERRAQLVEAAISVMTREGVRKATTRAIVGEAGASLSVFHYCFDSKQSLLQEVVTTIVGRTAGLAREALSSVEPGDDPLRASVMAYWNHVTAHPAEHLLTYEVTQHCMRDPELREVARVQYEHYATVIADHLHATLGDGLDEARATVIARYLAVIIDGLTLDWLARRDDEQATAVLDAAVDHVRQMWDALAQA